MARGGKFGWFLGLVFGTLFGFLFAPRKGKELRARMKADRKRGKLGIAPLSDDLKNLGQEIAEFAKDLYHSQDVQDIVEKGRTKVKSLSDDLVDEVTDFHKTRIAPFRRDLEAKVREGKKTVKYANSEWNDLKGKAKKSARIAKRAFGDIKGTMKKKPK